MHTARTPRYGLKRYVHTSVGVLAICFTSIGIGFRLVTVGLCLDYSTQSWSNILYDGTSINPFIIIVIGACLIILGFWGVDRRRRSLTNFLKSESGAKRPLP
jgi:vacuolar-type H+-ATPase subunit I/STV1